MEDDSLNKVEIYAIMDCVQFILAEKFQLEESYKEILRQAVIKLIKLKNKSV